MGVFSVCFIVGVWIVTTGTTVAQSLRFKFGVKVMQNDVMDEIRVPTFKKMAVGEQDADAKMPGTAMGTNRCLNLSNYSTRLW